MPDSPVEFVIVGITSEGKPFRPGDRAERRCSVMPAFGGDQRMQCSPYVHPVSAHGERGVAVDARLELVEPKAYRFLVNFGKYNDLRMRAGCARKRTLLAQREGSGEVVVGHAAQGGC